MQRLGEGHGTRFEFECYDVGHLYTLAHFLDRKLVKPPLFVQTIFGILGGIGPDPQNVMVMRETAERLFGDQYHWSVLAAGRFQFPLCTMAATMGANVRVGLEDNLYIGKGKLAKSNAELVAKMRRILDELSIETATPCGSPQDAGPQGSRERQDLVVVVVVGELFEVLIGAAGGRLETLFIVMEVLLWLLIESGELHHPQECIADQLAPEPHGPVEIKEQDNTFFVSVIPNLVFVGVIEYKDFARAPDIDGVANSHAALFCIFGYNQAEMGTHNPLTDTTMRGDVITRT